MITIIKRTLQTQRGAILGWGTALFGLALMVLAVYDSIKTEFSTYQELAANFPPEMMAFFGDFSQIASPVGYLSLEFFSYMPLIVGVFALLSGSGLLRSDEESGRLELIQAAPISRGALFFGRTIGLALVTILILALGWVGLALPLLWVEFEIGAGEMALGFLSMGVVMVWFSSLGLLLSQLLPSRKLAASATALVLILSFFMNGFAQINDSLKPLAQTLPLYYYQGGEAIYDFNGYWALGLLLGAAAMIWAAWWLYERRDLRVSGEGSFGWFKRRQHG